MWKFHCRNTPKGTITLSVALSTFLTSHEEEDCQWTENVEEISSLDSNNLHNKND